MEDYRKADAVRMTHDDYRRTATVAGKPPPDQEITWSVMYKWVLILLLQTTNALGFITVSPIMPFVQMQFFNNDVRVHPHPAAACDFRADSDRLLRASSLPTAPA